MDEGVSLATPHGLLPAASPLTAVWHSRPERVTGFCIHRRRFGVRLNRKSRPGGAPADSLRRGGGAVKAPPILDRTSGPEPFRMPEELDPKSIVVNRAASN
jgi:hypothetical protein